MSIQETNFIKWFGGIAASLVIAFIIGGVVMFRVVGVLSQNVQYNDREIKELRQFHKDDLSLIRHDINEIKEDNQEIKQDIKKLLAR